MSAYIVGQVEIHDPEEYEKYLAGFMPIFERYDGKILAVTSSATEVIEGKWEYPRTVIMQFPSLEKAHAWHNDPDYRKLAKHRMCSANVNLALIEGV